MSLVLKFLAIALCASLVACAPEIKQPETVDQKKESGCEEEATISGSGAEDQNAMEGTGFEGDVIGHKGEGSNRNAVKDASRKWPKSDDGNVYVPYKLNSDIKNSKAHMEAINAAINSYSDKTCIRFIQQSNKPAYLDVQMLDGCHSLVGRAGDNQQPQEVSLGHGCEYKSTVEHEFMHALGFLHEQSRPDRDDYITILTSNIKSGLEDQFAKGSSDDYTTQGLPYDPKSVMQYRETSFGKKGSDGKPMMTMKIKASKFPGMDVTHLGADSGANGESGDFTEGDVKKLNKLYNCDNSNPDYLGNEDITEGFLKNLDLSFSDNDIKTFLKKVNSYRKDNGLSEVGFNKVVSDKMTKDMQGTCNAPSMDCGYSSFTFSYYGQTVQAATAFNRFFDGVLDRGYFKNDMSAFACGFVPCGVIGSKGQKSIVNYVFCSTLQTCSDDSCSYRHKDDDPQSACASLLRQNSDKTSSWYTDACHRSAYTIGGVRYTPDRCCKTNGQC